MTQTLRIGDVKQLKVFKVYKAYRVSKAYKVFKVLVLHGVVFIVQQHHILKTI